MFAMTASSNDWMLPCPIKAWMHVDCPGCGFQRAFWDLLQGNFAECWHHYPPLIPFLLTVVVLIVALKTKIPRRMHLLVASVAVTCVFIVVNYALKMS